MNGEWYQCVEQPKKWGKTVCDLCAFHGIGNCELDKCSRTYRNDKKSVIFKKLEKVGEPFTTVGKLYQHYKVFDIDNVYGDVFWCVHNYKAKTLTIEIKQNKEDMEEKKDNYDGNMDKECIHICDALNSIPDVRTTESCCGHCNDRFMIFLTCDNSHSLAIIARVFDRRYIGTSQPWYIELQTKDDGGYDYFIHSETKYDSEEAMMKDVNQIIANIEHWRDDKFASHFKGCDDKLTFAPFDINLAKAGKPVRTRDGHKVRIICFDKKGGTPIVGLIQEDGFETVATFNESGLCLINGAYNLMMLPEKKEGWVNVYKGSLLDTKSYNTKKEAFDKASPRDYVDTVKISWKE